jgi:hypothetical protein
MTTTNFESMNLNELRQYVLTHRENLNAFQIYIDRSKSSGRMITINPGDPNWASTVEQKIQQLSTGETELS